MTNNLELNPFSSADESAKQTQPEILDSYIQDLESNVPRKFRLVRQNIPWDLLPGDVIVDCGTSSGQLAECLRSEFPKQRIVGIDLSTPMLQVAQRKKIDCNLLQADIFNMPLKKRGIKVFVLSSVFHELYSYGNIPYSKELVIQVLINLYEQLVDGGRIIIKDPARPENPEEVLSFKLTETDGTNYTSSEDLLRCHPNELSTFSKYLRFQLQFRSGLQIPENCFFDPKNKVFSAPAWFLSEFLRHRNLCDSVEHWDSEMVEQYGVFTTEEFKNVCESLNFTHFSIQSSYNPENHAHIQNQEVIIYDAVGNEVDQSERLPTGILVVIEKN